RTWNAADTQNEAFGQYAARVFYWIDWIPARLTGIAFAIVGNFEDAIYAWRNFAHRWPNESEGVILACGAGALGIRLGSPEESAIAVSNQPEPIVVDAVPNEADVMPGEPVGIRTLQSAVGLVWRALLLWM